MWHGKVLRWTGLVASFLCAMFSGIFLSFNVYAVQMKAKLDLSQTQVEFVGSFMMSALVFAFLGHFIIDKYGYVVCYVTAWALVTSSDLLMWLATRYTAFFGTWIGFVCLFHFINTLGASVAEMCCISYGLSQFHKRHAGKIIGVYLAGVALGKVYYATLYKIISQTEERLGNFFLSIPAGFTVAIVICIFCQKFTLNNDEADCEEISLMPAEGDSEEIPSSMDNDTTENEPTNMSLKDIAKSWAFHLFLWPNAMFVACNTTLMNNITTVAHDIGMKDSELPVYILSVGIIISRVCFGLLFDIFQTRTAGMCLLIFCQVAFAIAMAIGWFRVTVDTVIIMTALSSMGIGVGFSLSLTILGLEFGLQRYSLIMGIFELGTAISVFIAQLFTGIVHDHITQTSPDESRCYDCFHWCFFLLFCGSLIAALLTLIKIFVANGGSSCDKGFHCCWVQFFHTKSKE